MASVTSLTASVQQHLASALTATRPEATGVDPLLRRSDRADFQANGILALAKKSKANPRELATEVVSHITTGDLIKDVEVSGPGFLNITIADRAITANLAARLADGERLGVPLKQDAGTTVVDYAQPNVAKEMHVGHLRSAVIGDALRGMLDFTGERTIGRHHIGDWGTQFGMLIQYLFEHPGELAPAEDVDGEQAMSNLNRVYKASRALFDADEEFKERARKRVVALQSGDKETLELWQQFVDESKVYFYSVFEKLDMEIRDEEIVGESAYNEGMPETARLLEEMGVAVRSEGALVVFFDEIRGKDDQPVPLIVQKADGGFGYAASDLTAIRNRVQDLHATTLLYVVDVRQSLHFKMVFETARRAGWLGDEVTAHNMGYGTVLGADGKPFKTRAGETVRLEDLLDEAVQRAAEVVREKARDLTEDEIQERAAQVGIGGREVRGPVDVAEPRLQVRPGPDGLAQRRHLRVPPVRLRPDPVHPPQGRRGPPRRPPGAGAARGGARAGPAPGRVRGHGLRGGGGVRPAQAGRVPVPAGVAVHDVLRQVPGPEGRDASAGGEPPLPVRPHGPHPAPGHGPAGHPDARAALSALTAAASAPRARRCRTRRPAPGGPAPRRTASVR
ncbi:arginyl-tRNA synthetase [Streptomyces ambofaciens]